MSIAHELKTSNTVLVHIYSIHRHIHIQIHILMFRPQLHAPTTPKSLVFSWSTLLQSLRYYERVWNYPPVIECGTPGTGKSAIGSGIFTLKPAFTGNCPDCHVWLPEAIGCGSTFIAYSGTQGRSAIKVIIANRCDAYETIWNHMNLYETIWNYMKLNETTWNYMKLYEAIWN